jgi:hypothetical protein
MLLLLLLLLPFHTWAIECLTYDGWVESLPDVKCAQCEFLSYLDDDGSCVVQPFITTTTVSEVTVSACYNEIPTIVQCENEFGECVLCTYGVAAKECSYRGHLIRDEQFNFRCVCYSNRLDPKNQCQKTPLDQTEPFVVQVMSGVIEEKITCDSFNSNYYGCFKPVDSSNHQYGEPNPPVPIQCCHENLGPPPNQLTEEILLLPNNTLIEYEECNRPGGYNVNYNASTNETREWEVCNGQGLYNSTTRQCECYRGWQLTFVGGYDDVQLFSCIDCQPLFGPSPYDDEEGPFCSMIWTPDPLDGELKECSGHGKYLNGVCDCTVGGFWELVNVTRLGVTVETCAKEMVDNILDI